MSTQPFEQLNVDFKGPLVSNNNNRYFLTVIDEYLRFPFIFPCANTTTATVIKCFCGLFSMFGMPAYIHSDRGAAFMSTELRNFLHQKEIATSRTTPLILKAVDNLRGTMELSGEHYSRPSDYRHRTGKRFFLMHYTLFDHCSVLLQTRLPMSGCLASLGDLLLAGLFLLGL